MKEKLDQRDNCECNLTDIEHDIRQNGIEIAKVRHLVVLNGYHITDNLDNINQNKIEVDTKIDAVEMDLEVSINNVKIDTEASIDKVKTNLENSIADTKTRVDISKNTAKII